MCLHPFAWTNVSSGKKTCFAIWLHVPSFPIYGWLTWWCDFFPVGPAFEDYPQVFSPKRSSPLDFIFDTCASASSRHLFFVGEAEHMWLYPFARTNAFSAENICFVIWARVDTKFLNSSHYVLYVDDWPGDATFFLWGQPLKIIRKYSAKKKVQPLGFYFWHLRLGLLKSPFLVGEAEQMWLYPFARTNAFSEKKGMFCNLGALRQNSWIRPVMSYLWMIGLEMRLFSCGANLWRLSASIQSKKVQPLGFYFWPLRLGLLKSPFFGWWSWTDVVVPFCKDKCIFRKKRHVLQFGRVETKFLNSSRHVLSVDDWPGDATFFLWGQPLKIIRKYSVQKGPAPWILFLTPAPRPLEVTFFGWWSWTDVVVPFCKDKCIFRKKRHVLQFGRVETKFLNSSRHVLSVDDWPGDATFFLWGQPLKIIRKYLVQKGPAPWILFLTPAPWPLEVTFFWLVKVHICVCTLLQSHVKNHTPSINHGTFFPGVWHLDMF